jgi:hypothetical protein
MTEKNDFIIERHKNDQKTRFVVTHDHHQIQQIRPKKLDRCCNKNKHIFFLNGLSYMCNEKKMVNNFNVTE